MKLVIGYHCESDSCVERIQFPFVYESIESAHRDILAGVEDYINTGEATRWQGISVDDFMSWLWHPTEQQLFHFKQAGINVYYDIKYKKPVIFIRPEIITVDEWFEKYKLQDSTEV